MQLSEAREEYVRWLLATRDLSQHTIRAYSSDIGMVERHFGQKARVDQLEQASLVAFIEQQRAGGLGAASVRRRVSGLRGFCKWLVARGLLSSDPWAGATIAIRRARHLPRALPAHDLDRLLRSLRTAARTDENSVVSPEEAFQRTTLLAVVLMVTTGVRVSEVVSIKCPDIDFAGRSIRIIGKGRRERHVFLTNPWICKVTSEYLKMRTTLGVAHPYLLFNMSLGPLTTSAVRARLAKVARDAAISTRLTPHILRHTAATQLIEAGVDIRYIQRLLGHASLTTTEIYTHVSDGTLKRVVSNADVLGRFPSGDN